MDKSLLISEDFQKCIDFHGHICGGLALGYQASKAAMNWLKLNNRALDEEIVAIVENDACGVDAVQVLTGCTFGKGNFIYRDYGKMAFTFFSRNTGYGVRVAPKSNLRKEADENQRELFEKVRNNTATDEDKEKLRNLGEQKAFDILETPVQDLFTLNSAKVPIPEKARIEPSKECDRCKEPAMSTKMKNIDGKYLCMGCLEK